MANKGGEKNALLYIPLHFKLGNINTICVGQCQPAAVAYRMDLCCSHTTITVIVDHSHTYTMS